MVAFRPMTEADVPARRRGLRQRPADHAGPPQPPRHRQLDPGRAAAPGPHPPLPRHRPGRVVGGRGRRHHHRDVAVLRARGLLDAVAARHRAGPPGPRRRAASCSASRSRTATRRAPARSSAHATPRRWRSTRASVSSLHPVVAAWGVMRPGSVTSPAEVTPLRARSRSPIASWRWSPPSTARCAGRPGRSTSSPCSPSPGTGCCSTRTRATPWREDERIVTLGARQEESASLVLRAMLAEAPAGETIEINWLTSAQQWAIRVVVEAGIELQPYGPVMVRGMDGPPSPTSRAAGTAEVRPGPRDACRWADRGHRERSSSSVTPCRVSQAWDNWGCPPKPEGASRFSAEVQ